MIVKKHEQLCGYRIDSRFVAKSGRIEMSEGKTSFLAADAFVNDTIWVKSSQAFMQYILNIANEFFVINNISINNNKTVLYHPSLYELKPFEQVQSEEKLVSLILFSNGYGILEHLFNYRFLDLQVLGWSPLNPLQFPVRLHIGAATATKEDVLSVLDSDRLSEVRDSLLEIWSDCIEVYIDGSLKCAGSVGVADGAAADAGIGVKVTGLLSSTLAELLLNSSSSAILLLLLSCSLNVGLYTAVYKDFVIKNWYAEAVSVFERKKKAIQTLVEFIRFVVELQCTQIWTVRTKHRAEIEKTNLVGDNGVISGLFSSIVSTLSAGIVYMLGIIESFAVKFGRHKLCCFFSDLGGDAFVTIGV
ncbi:hypothetical protein G9A89_005371 [Geosiphon pyriformis]|nr:hypothetical protein G9A89_005371 [Geosiphon pyriformis]